MKQINRRQPINGRGLLNIRGLLVGLFCVYASTSFNSPIQALEMSSANRRITRTSINCGGGAGDQPSGSTNYRLRGSVDGNGTGVMSSATKKVADGLMKIFFYPGTVTTLAPAPGTQAGELNLTWNAPGADGNRRIATGYVIKYSTFPTPISDMQYFENSATTYGHSLSPQSAGSIETLVLTGLQPDTTYYVAVVARDEDKNQSRLSSAASSWACSYRLGVTINNTSGAAKFYDFGAISMSSAVVSTATIQVANTGTVASNWSLRAATATALSPWTLTRGTQGQDQARVSAAFKATQPSSTTFSSDLGFEDRMITTEALATGTTFSIDGVYTGAGVPVSGTRNVWFMMETPPVTSTLSQQSIQVTVTANP